MIQALVRVCMGTYISMPKFAQHSDTQLLGWSLPSCGLCLQEGSERTCWLSWDTSSSTGLYGNSYVYA